MKTLRTKTSCSRLPDSPVRWQIVETARHAIGKMKYCYRCEDCRPDDPVQPTINCGMLVHWACKQLGLPVPKPSDQLLLDLFDGGGLTQIPAIGDLVFRLDQDPRHSFTSPRHGLTVSHVGIYTGEENDSVVHAAKDRETVVEDSLDDFSRFTEKVNFVDLLSLREHPEALAFEGHV